MKVLAVLLVVIIPSHGWCKHQQAWMLTNRRYLTICYPESLEVLHNFDTCTATIHSVLFE